MQPEKVTALNRSVEAGIEFGYVQEDTGRGIVVRGESSTYLATRAFSCLIAPEPGDRVMLGRDSDSCHVIAVIERPSGKNATLSFQGDLTIDVPQGDVSIASQQQIRLASAKSVDLVSDGINVMAGKGIVNIDDALFAGRQLTSHISNVRTFAKSIETVADRLTQKLQHSFRLIQGVDQTKAGEILATVKNLFSLRSRQSAILAEKDIKIDAERIHMG
jgi:hypothetical protein